MKQKYKQQPQCAVIASDLSSSSPDSTKTFKVLIALLFLTYGKKGAVLFFDSLEEVCSRVCSFLYVHELFSNKKKSKIIFVYCHENRNIIIQHNTLPVFLLLFHIDNTYPEA